MRDGKGASAISAEEARLWAAIGEGDDARQSLFDAYLPLARGIASRHYTDRSGADIEFGDLHQLACAGLLEAIDGFDPARGTPFAAFARKRINGSVRDGIAKLSELREQLSYRGRVRRERIRSLGERQLDELRGEDAMQALIDLAAGLAIGFMLEGTSLYVEGDAPSREPNAYESFVWKQAVGRVLDGLESLPRREAEIIKRHYFDGLTFDRIGALLGLSKGRVSQLHRHALRLLRKRLGSAEHFRLTG